jgi:hypothetical protein
VSSALLSLLNSSQINVALELHRSITNTTHPFPSPIAPDSLTSDLTVASARHLTVDRPSRAPSNQINPSTMIPYPHPCLATSPTPRNRDRDREPPRNLTGGRLRPVRPPRHPSLTPSPLLAGTWARAHDVIPTLSPAGGRACAR